MWIPLPSRIRALLIVWASSVLPSSGQAFQCPTSYRDRLHRRFAGGLGRSLSGVDDFGRLESSRLSAPHLCVRTFGSVLFPFVTSVLVWYVDQFFF